MAVACYEVARVSASRCEPVLWMKRVLREVVFWGLQGKMCKKNFNMTDFAGYGDDGRNVTVGA
jgi:hypothetical protein